MAKTENLSLSKAAIEAFVAQDREAQSGAAISIWPMAYAIANYIASGFTQAVLGAQLLVERFREKPFCVSSGKESKPTPPAEKGGTVQYVCETCRKAGLTACEARTPKRVIDRVPITQQRVSELLRAYRYASGAPTMNAKGESQPAGFAHEADWPEGVNPFEAHNGRASCATTWQAAEFVRLASGSKLPSAKSRDDKPFTLEALDKRLLVLAVACREMPLDGQQFLTHCRAAWKVSEKAAKAKAPAKPPVDVADIAEARKAHEARKAADEQRKAKKRAERKAQAVTLPPMPDSESPENDVLTESEALAANGKFTESQIEALASVA